VAGVERVAVVSCSQAEFQAGRDRHTTALGVNADVQAATERALLGKGYIVVDRLRLENTMRELDMQHEDAFDADSRKQLGNLIGIDAFFYVVVTRRRISSGGSFLDNVTGQLVSVADSAVLATGIYTPRLFSGIENEGIPYLMENFPEYAPAEKRIGSSISALNPREPGTAHLRLPRSFPGIETA